MQPVYDITELRLLLRRGIASGHWTLEHLDIPSKGYQQLVDEMSRHKVIELRSFPVPAYRNPLREQDPAPRVEVVSPRDLASEF